MAVSIDTYLKKLASSYYLKNDSTETAKINTSQTNLLKNLNKDMGLLINRAFIFGSWDRDTILPRKYDSNSDIDIMVIFNHTDYERTPETYRGWLKIFADKYYHSSNVIKSFPTVTIKLNHIKYDLVPAKEEALFKWMKPTIYIPDSAGGWRSTDPSDVKLKLTNANTKYKYIVKPIIRLLKAWNCNAGYPFDSYLLELKLASLNYYNDNVQSGFLYAIKQLSADWNDSQTTKNKLTSLKNNAAKVEEALKNDQTEIAKFWLHKILP